MLDFKFKVKRGRATIQNLTLLEAHAELGKQAQKYNLALHIHEGDWSGTFEYSVAYIRGGDMLLDAVAYVQRMV